MTSGADKIQGFTRFSANVLMEMVAGDDGDSEHDTCESENSEDSGASGMSDAEDCEASCSDVTPKKTFS